MLIPSLIALLSQRIVVDQPRLVAVIPMVIDAKQYHKPLQSPVRNEGGVGRSCVLTARKYASVPVPRGNAGELEPNGKPIIGGLILMDYDGEGHVAVIRGFTNEGFWVIEGNYEQGKVTKRVVAYDDEHIVGFRDK